MLWIIHMATSLVPSRPTAHDKGLLPAAVQLLLRLPGVHRSSAPMASGRPRPNAVGFYPCWFYLDMPRYTPVGFTREYVQGTQIPRFFLQF